MLAVGLLTDFTNFWTFSPLDFVDSPEYHVC